MSPEREHELTLLMAAGQKGDRVAYEALLREVRMVATSYVRHRVGTATWSEDVVQDVLLSVHRARHTWNPARPFAPWFYAVMHSRLIDAIRRHKRTADLEGPIDETPPPVLWSASPESAAIAQADLSKALEMLSPAQRRVIVRLKLDGMSVKHVAKETGLSQSHVKVIAHRGYRTLRRLLGRAGDDH